MQGDIGSLPAGLKVDAILVADARLAAAQLGRLPQLLAPHGIVVLCCSSATSSSDSSSSDGSGGGSNGGGSSTDGQVTELCHDLVEGISDPLSSWIIAHPVQLACYTR